MGRSSRPGNGESHHGGHPQFSIHGDTGRVMNSNSGKHIIDSAVLASQISYSVPVSHVPVESLGRHVFAPASMG